MTTLQMSDESGLDGPLGMLADQLDELDILYEQDEDDLVILFGGECSVNVSYDDDIDSLQFISSYLLEYPPLREKELWRFIGEMNVRSSMGGFTLYRSEQGVTLLYRHTHVVGGDLCIMQTSIMMSSISAVLERGCKAAQLLARSTLTAEQVLDFMLEDAQGEA